MRPARSTNEVNALIHLHRAEVGRLTAYRTRLDTTTNWAVSSSALVATFTFGEARLSHAAFIMLMFLVYFFLYVEARRYRYYEVSRYRVQLLERNFYPEILGQAVEPTWTEHLVETLRVAVPRPSRLGALGWRLRRNYLGIYAGVLVAWLVKLDISGPPTWDPLELVGRAALGSIPGEAVLLLVAAFYVWLVALALLARRIYPLGDDEARQAR